MKYLALIPVLVAAFLGSSCRTVPPLDPLTMKPACKCLPENYQHRSPCGGATVEATK